MGVMACDREGCDKVMCDTLIDDSYICDECKAEFKEYVGGETTHLRRDLIIKFREFMQTEKICGNNDDISVEDFLNGK